MIAAMVQDLLDNLYNASEEITYTMYGHTERIEEMVKTSHIREKLEEILKVHAQQQEVVAQWQNEFRALSEQRKQQKGTGT
jgi:cell shape-determining protein MreC